jgi:uncharacterized protein
MLSGAAIFPAILKLLLVLGFSAIFTGIVLAFLMAMVLLRPPRMGSGKALAILKRLSPADLGLAYEAIHFTVPDCRGGKPIRIPGWWMPHPTGSDRCALILHGFGDAKVGAIAWTPLLQSLGFNILAVDLRAHGDNHGGFSTAGFDERFDICDVLDQTKAERPEQTRQIILLGISLGAAVVSAVAVMRQDLAAVLLECPYRDFRDAAAHHAGALGMPGRLIPRVALWMCQAIARIDYGQVRPVDMIPVIRCPLWVVQTCDDPFLTDADRSAIEAAVRSRPAEFGPSEVWTVADCHHVIAMAEHPEEYRRRLEQFLSQIAQPARVGTSTNLS